MENRHQTANGMMGKMDVGVPHGVLSMLFGMEGSAKG